MSEANEFPTILGVFSLRRAEDVGTGATQSRHTQLTYWYARRFPTSAPWSFSP